MFEQILTLALLFYGLHSLCDYPWQGPYLAQAKQTLTDPMRGYHLLCHSSIQATGVYVVTFMVGTPNIHLALAEFILHTIIDEAKVRGITTYPQDQALHLLCKMVYIVILAVLPIYPIF